MPYRVAFRRPRARTPVIILAKDLDEAVASIKRCLAKYFAKTDVIEIEMRDSRHKLLARFTITKHQ